MQLTADADKIPDVIENLGGNSQTVLRNFIERIERLDEEKRSLASDIRDIFAEAKSQGFDAKAMRKVIALRRLDSNERREQQTMLDVYMHALGMLEE